MYININARKKFKSEVTQQWRWATLEIMLQETHVILVADDKHLKQIMGEYNGKKLLAQTTRSSHTCFQPVNDTWFYVIVNKAFKSKDSDTVVHEAMHVVSRVLFDDWQGGHDSPKFWDEFGPNSLQAAVKEDWDISRALHSRRRMPWML